MDPTTMALILGGSTAIGGLGSILGGNAMSNAGDQAREASRRSIEMSRLQGLLGSQNMSPFIGAGMGAMYDLYGYSPVDQGYQGGAGSTGVRYLSGGGTGGNAFTVPGMVATGDRWNDPMVAGGTTYARTGQGFDPTGGAGQYMEQLKNYGTNFNFDENNPLYQQKVNENNRLMNRVLASRGLFNSSMGVRELGRQNRQLMGEEFDKQYQRGYTNLVDLYNMARQQGQTGYNALLDAVKVGTGAAGASGQMGLGASGQLQSAYGQSAQNAFANAGGQAQMYGGLAGTAMGGLNNYLLYNLLGNQGRSGYTPQYQSLYNSSL